MRLVIGGYAQGKLDYVLGNCGFEGYVLQDGTLPKDMDRPVIINHFHRWVKQRIAEGGCPEKEIFGFLEHQDDCIIICDEIGNGIVPDDRLEREYRERTGRILIGLAARAERVERVICGIGQRIK